MSTKNNGGKRADNSLGEATDLNAGSSVEGEKELAYKERYQILSEKVLTRLIGSL